MATTTGAEVAVPGEGSGHDTEGVASGRKAGREKVQRPSAPTRAGEPQRPVHPVQQLHLRGRREASPSMLFICPAPRTVPETGLRMTVAGAGFGGMGTRTTGGFGTGGVGRTTMSTATRAVSAGSAKWAVSNPGIQNRDVPR